MLEEEYQERRVLPRHLRKQETPETPFEYAIRDARPEDLPHVREIYNHYVANSTVTFDEDAMTLREWKSKYAYLHKLGMPFIVAESPTGQILGYALVSPWKQKRAYRFTVENSIYLGAASTGKGLGPVLMQALIDKSQEFVTGEVTLKLYKGGVHLIGRQSPYTLYDQDLVTFEEGAVAYDHRDAAGFIKLNALRLRTLAQRKKKLGL